MSVPSNIYDVKRRIDRYLWEDETLPLVRLRELLRTYFLDFEKVAIVGGMVRDFARSGPSTFKSDIDLVIEADDSAVRDLAGHLRAMENRFGGFSYQGSLWKIDFWSLESTWASRNGHVAINSIEDIINCTFFDYDSVAYNLKKSRIYSKNGYLERLRQRKIEINLLPNPSVSGNLLRAIRRTLLWNLQPGPVLRAFIESNLTKDVMKEIATIESAIYADPIVGLFKSPANLMREVNFRSGRKVLNPSYGVQLELPLEIGF